MTVYFGGIFLWRVRRIPAGAMPLHPAWIFFTKRQKNPRPSPGFLLPQFNAVFWGHIQFVVFCDVERVIPRVNVR